MCALKAAGLRLTRQRLEIIREIAGAVDHPDADVIFHRVRERVPTISPDTVYRTLDVLARRGLVERIPMPRATRFDPDLSPHHHFVCDRCGRLVDVRTDVISPVPAPPTVLDGIGDVHSVHLQMWGTCKTCMEQGSLC